MSMSWIYGKSVFKAYSRMSKKAWPIGLTTYRTLYFLLKDWINGCILYKLCLGMVGNKLNDEWKDYKASNSLVYLSQVWQVDLLVLDLEIEMASEPVIERWFRNVASGLEL